MAIPETDLQRARAAIVRVAEAYLPDLKRSGNEYECCCPFHDERTPSFKVNEDKQLFHCFGCGANGDAIDLVMRMTGKPFADAVQSITGTLSTDITPAQQKKNSPKQPWKQEGAAPAGVAAKHIAHPLHGTPSASWLYTDSDGNVIGYTCRFDRSRGGKEIIPYTWCTNTETGAQSFRWLGFAAPRTIYGLRRLVEKPAAPILIVEGEKTADAAQAMLRGYNVISWAGGGNAVKKTDWEVCRGRSVVLWPDGDEAGTNAMREVFNAIRDIADSVKIVPSPYGDGWDLADDPLEADFEIVKWARENMQEASAFFDPQSLIARTPDSLLMPSREPPAIVWVDTPVGTSNKTPCTLVNFQALCNAIGVTIRYNVIAKEIEIIIPGERYSVDNNANAAMAKLLSYCEKYGYPSKNIDAYVTYLGDQNLYNPVATWIESREWDGVSRIQAICDTITTDDDMTGLKDTLIRRWLTSAVAAAFMPEGVSAHGVLVLQGEQYLGKTAWLKSLAPPEMGVIQDGMMLRPDDKDSVKQVCSHWIVELGELDATFRRSDIAQLKAFITRSRDIIRRPFARAESHYARRTVLFASVNPRQFLQDTTGNRRYWTIACHHINYAHDIDMQQLWREVYDTIFLPWWRAENRGTLSLPWVLTGAEMDKLSGSNEQFDSIDPITERLNSWLDWDSDPFYWEWMTATDIMSMIGYDRPTRSDVTHCAHVLGKIGKIDRKRSNGRNLTKVPKRLEKF